MNVIINADDFGIDVDRDLGICYGVLKGYITSVSVIVTNDITPLRKFLVSIMKKKASVGIHINLTDDPLCKYQCSDLYTNYYHYSKNKYIFWRNAVENNIRINLVEMEMMAQLQKFIEGYGFAPEHIDGHNHCNIFHRDIQKIFENVAETQKIHLRIPYELLTQYSVEQLSAFTDFSDFIVSSNYSIGKLLDNWEYYIKYDMILNNVMCKWNCGLDIPFLGTIYGYIRNSDFLIKQIRDYTNAPCIQIMTHPGFYIPFARHSVWFSNRQRFDELRCLKKLKKELKKMKIGYTNYRSVY